MSWDDDAIAVEFDECKRETDRAVCLIVEDKTVWIPKSVIAPGFVPDVFDGPGRTWVAEWFAEKEGLV